MGAGCMVFTSHLLNEFVLFFEGTITHLDTLYGCVFNMLSYVFRTCRWCLFMNLLALYFECVSWLFSYLLQYILPALSINYLEIIWLNQKTNTYKNKTLLRLNNTALHKSIQYFSSLVASLALTLLSYTFALIFHAHGWMPWQGGGLYL